MAALYAKLGAAAASDLLARPARRFSSNRIDSVQGCRTCHLSCCRVSQQGIHAITGAPTNSQPSSLYSQNHGAALLEKPTSFVTTSRPSLNSLSRRTITASTTPFPNLVRELREAQSISASEIVPDGNDPCGLSEQIVRLISARNKEPEWMLRFRLDAYQQWLRMEPPKLVSAKYNSCPPAVDFRGMCCNLAMPAFITTDDAVDRLGSFAAIHKEALTAAGVVFCSISEAIAEYPELVRKHLGKVAPPTENYYAALNSAVFTEGSFCYVPKNTVCPMDISTHFLVNGRKVTSQFERTLIVCDDNSYVSSLGCTSPADASEMNAAAELRAAVIELYCAEGAEIKHVTVQNWALLQTEEEEEEKRPSCNGDGPEVFNFVTQRGVCEGPKSKITWTAVEAGSAVAWQRQSVVLKGDGSVAECFSVSLTNSGQRSDLSASMIHVGSNTRSRVVAKSISAGASQSSFRCQVHVDPSSENARNQSQWDAILIGDNAESTAHPSVVARNASAQVEQKGSTSRISREQVFYLQQRGIRAEKAVSTILTGFCSAVLRELPQEFESEVTEMVESKIEEALKSSSNSSCPY